MAKKKNRRLTVKQQAFAEHYVLHGNASEAYRRAYNTNAKPDTVKAEAQRLLNNPHVAPTIEALLKRVAEIAEEKFDIKAEDILQEIAAVAFYNAEDFFEWGIHDGKPFARLKPSADLTRTQKAAIESVQELIAKTGGRATEVQMGDKLGALKLLAQHLGLLKNVVENTGKNGGPVMAVNSEEQPHAITHASSTTLRSANPETEPVLSAGDV